MKQFRVNISSVCFWSYAVCIFLFSSGTSAQEELPTVQRKLPEAYRGTCLPELSGDAEAILKGNEVTVVMGNKTSDSLDDTKTEIARVYQAINNIGTGELEGHKDVRFILRSGTRASQNHRDYIELAGEEGGGERGMNNPALIAMMLGYRVLNKGDNISNYIKNVPNACITSLYARSPQTRRRAEFAEVFAAYVVNPKILKNKPGGCSEAYNFMSNLFGVEESKTSTSCQERKAGIMSSLTSQETGNTGSSTLERDDGEAR